jgi:uncharacterized protein (TIGR03435 family)
MLQNLIAERFQLVIHHDTKMFPVYELVVAKSGPKLKESVESSGAVAPPVNTSPVARDEEGFPLLPLGQPGIISSYGPGGGRLADRLPVNGQVNRRAPFFHSSTDSQSAKTAHK